jgi:hypothetical protein
MNARTVNRFIQVPLQHYSSLVAGVDVLANFVKDVTYHMAHPGTCTREDLRKRFAEAKNELDPLLVEIDRGEQSTSLVRINHIEYIYV